MFKIKKKFKKSIIVFTFISLLIFPIVSFGADISAQLDRVMQKAGAYDSGIDGETSLVFAIARIINIILSLLGVIFLVLLIYGGFMWMTARGNESQVEAAKKIITRAIIGVIIILISFVVSWFVMSRLSDLTSDLTNP